MQCVYLPWGSFLLPAKVYPPLLCCLNPLALPLSTSLRLKLCHRSQHVKEPTASRIAGIDALVEHMQVAPFPG